MNFGICLKSILILQKRIEKKIYVRIINVTFFDNSGTSNVKAWQYKVNATSFSIVLMTLFLMKKSISPRFMSEEYFPIKSRKKYYILI